MIMDVTNLEHAEIILRAYFAPFLISFGVVTSVVTVAVYVKSSIGGPTKIHWVAIATGDLVYLIFRASILNWLGDGLRYSTDGLFYVYVDQANVATCKITKSLGYIAESYSSWILAYVSFETAFVMHFPAKAPLLLNRKMAWSIDIAVLAFLVCVIGVPCAVGVTIAPLPPSWTPVVCALNPTSSDLMVARASKVALMIIGVFDYLLPSVSLVTTSTLISRKFLKNLQLQGDDAQREVSPHGVVHIDGDEQQTTMYIAIMQAKSGFHLTTLIPASVLFCVRSAAPTDSAVFALSGNLNVIISIVITIFPLTNFLLNICGSAKFRSSLLLCLNSCCSCLKKRTMKTQRPAGNSSPPGELSTDV
jgi:hypothetical protein